MKITAMRDQKKFISYYRVSTDKQGVSGLGLEAQKAIVANNTKGGIVIAEYSEVESGKNANRPELLKALGQCKATGATLVIAKLDRLSRNLNFITNLQNSGIEFIACDLPYANKLTIQIMGAMAEHEREMISTRTKDALKALKARGVKLGCPIDKVNTKPAIAASIAIRKANATNNENNKHAKLLIKSLSKNGLNYSQIVAELNTNGYKTRRGCDFRIETVRRFAINA